MSKYRDGYRKRRVRRVRPQPYKPWNEIYRELNNAKNDVFNGVRTHETSGSVTRTELLPSNETFKFYDGHTQRVRERHRGDHHTPLPYFSSTVRSQGCVNIECFASQFLPDWGSPYWPVPKKWYPAQRMSMALPCTALYAWPCDTKVAELQNDVVKAAVSAYFDKIDSLMTHFDLLSETAEAQETVEFLIKPLVFLKDNIQLYRKRDIAGLLRLWGLKRSVRITEGPFAGRPAKVVVRTLLRRTPDPAAFAANMWLVNRYAVQPLIYGVEDSLAVLGQMEDADLNTKKVQVTLPMSDIVHNRKERYNASYVDYNDMLSYNSWGGVPSYDARTMLTVNGSYRIRGKMKFRRNLSDLLNAEGLENYVNGVWQGVPFSFVLDWFYDVSGWLSQISISKQLFDYSDERTIKATVTLKHWLENIQLNNDATHRNWIGRVEENLFLSECVHFQREVHTSPPAAVPPTLEYGMDRWRRKFDAIALCYTFYKTECRAKNVSSFSMFVSMVERLMRKRRH